MVLRTVLLVVLLLSVRHVSTAWTFDCPVVCQCSSENFTCSRETQGERQVPSSLHLRILHLQQKEIQSGSFKGLVKISRIEISQSVSLQRIRYQAFLSLQSVTEIVIQNVKNLEVIENGAFTHIPKLQYLSICNTGITQFPDLSLISSQWLQVLEMEDNIMLDSIPPNAFIGIAQYSTMNLVRNGFKEIKSHAFNATDVETLNLKDNWYLHTIHKDAFEGAFGPVALDVSSTALSSLPVRGLKMVAVLTARSTPAMKTLPPLDVLGSLVEAHLTYPSHCCAFNSWNRPHPLIALLNLTRFCKEGVEGEAMDLDTTSDSGAAQLAAINFHYPDLDPCMTNSPLRCTPEPDAFNPCEDLLGSDYLRSAIWLVMVLAVVGNLTVLVVLLSSQQKMTVSRFLMCHLAFADLCMGLYLLLIAEMDNRSRHQYYNHATDWQTGPGCSVAGFLTVFASELSVYTLTIITLERWHTITHAMEVERRLRLRHMVAIMAGGWVFSLLMALLPLLGVSSYSKVSICLPMDIDSPVSQVYIIVVLLINVVAFLVVCGCYLRIYASVRNPEVRNRRCDTKMAKRMAVLIFTDFLCMAPISFFAISAALRMPLITVSHSKILLVVFYPINSFCNPFLYTIFTRAFRQDIGRLFRRCGCGQGRFFGTDSFGPPGQPKPPKCTAPSKKARSLKFYAFHIKVQGCLQNTVPAC